MFSLSQYKYYKENRFDMPFMKTNRHLGIMTETKAPKKKTLLTVLVTAGVAGSVAIVWLFRR